MLKSISKLFLIGLLVILTGCASQIGPMQRHYTGPVDTPAFEPIVLDQVQDGSDTVLFKELAGLYEGKTRTAIGIFFITENGVYLAAWNTKSYAYDLHYRLPIDQIESMQTLTLERDYMYDPDVLIIKDKHGIEMGFSIKGRSSAKSILLNALKRQQESELPSS